MNLQIVSDLHLETRSTGEQIIPFDVSAPYLALLGDVGDPSSLLYEGLLRWAAAEYKQVFVVMGNHEFWGRPYKKTLEIVEKFKQELPENVIFMNQGVYDVEGTTIRIVGCTLWSYIPFQDRIMTGFTMNDYKSITSWSVSKNNRVHRDDLAWLESQLYEACIDCKKVVVLTHHAPTRRGTSAPKYCGNEFSTSFSTHLEHLFKLPVIVWAHGHTHYSGDQNVNGVRLVSNQYGYNDEGKDETGWRRDFCVKIEI